MMKEKNCAGCKFWETGEPESDSDTRKGMCRYFPPSHPAGWASTRGRDWCAQFQHRIDKPLLKTKKEKSREKNLP